MPIHITCSCGQLLVVPESRIGQSVLCPRCEKSVIITRPSVQTEPDQTASVPPQPDDDGLPIPVIQPISRQRWEHEIRVRRDVTAAYWLALAIMVLATVSVIPLLIVARGSGKIGSVIELDPWGYVLIATALLQCAYVIYLVQIPDWSTMRVISVVTLVHATVYAMIAGLRILAPHGNPFTLWLGLDAVRFTAGQQAGWCLMLLLLYASLCYLAGHFAGSWRRRALG